MTIISKVIYLTFTIDTILEKLMPTEPLNKKLGSYSKPLINNTFNFLTYIKMGVQLKRLNSNMQYFNEEIVFQTYMYKHQYSIKMLCFKMIKNRNHNANVF